MFCYSKNIKTKRNLLGYPAVLSACYRGRATMFLKLEINVFFYVLSEITYEETKVGEHYQGK